MVHIRRASAAGPWFDQVQVAQPQGAELRNQMGIQGLGVCLAGIVGNAVG